MVLHQHPGQHDGRAAADPGGLATQYSSAGHFDLAEDQALIITLPVTDAPYLGFQLGSLWYISLDYINHQTSLNGT